MPTGTCFCGDVKYEFSQDQMQKAICHCLSCRKITGSTYTTNFIIPESNFTLTSGSLRDCTRPHECGMDLSVFFCGGCGSTIYKKATGDMFKGVIVLLVGTVDNAEGVEKAVPDREFYVKHRGDWLQPVQGAVQDAASKPTSKREQPRNPNQHDDNNGRGPTGDPPEPPPLLNKPVLIPKKELKKLLDSKGREMYERLKNGLTSNRQRTVWSGGNHRIDPAHSIQGNSNLKPWNLHVQREAASTTSRDLKDKFGTHAKLIWDVFNIANPPSFQEWCSRLLSLYNSF
ncbi:Mss4-like protein [Aspergillus avenaceus]|uniref:Mss4-like protein n=1 Tax=Aspergillus avenaceus TaxID=36643 RepID=A0A5N6U145_ASPAV|nr:Mss4-like protein [Aspergillus avenaceus]